jgi:hypothetical protein
MSTLKPTSQFISTGMWLNVSNVVLVSTLRGYTLNTYNRGRFRITKVNRVKNFASLFTHTFNRPAGAFSIFGKFLGKFQDVKL